MKLKKRRYNLKQNKKRQYKYMRITIYVHGEDLENLYSALNSEESHLNSVRVLEVHDTGYTQVSLTYDEYVKCQDLGIFEELLSL